MFKKDICFPCIVFTMKPFYTLYLTVWQRWSWSNPFNYNYNYLLQLFKNLYFLGSNHGRSLGIRRVAHKLCLFDPFEENALVLYHPPDVTAHDKLNVKKLVFFYFFHLYKFVLFDNFLLCCDNFLWFTIVWINYSRFINLKWQFVFVVHDSSSFP